MTDWRDIRVTDGTAQEDRLPFALRDGYFLVDEMPFEQLLAMSAELAGSIAFYGMDGKRRGDWSALFDGSGAVLMALLLARDTRRMEAEFARCEEAGLAASAAYAYRTARFIDSGLRRLRRLDSRAAVELSERVTGLVRERLAARLRELASVTRTLQTQGELSGSVDYAEFDPAWGASATPALASSPDLLSVHGGAEVRRSFQAFSATIAHLKSLAGPYLEESLQTGNHDPAMGLFVAFLRLFGAVQAQLNGFTERHLDFYYARVLGAAPRPARGERALLAVATSAVARSVMVDAGTRWLASGAAPDEVRVFTSTDPLLLRPATVSALCTLHLHRDQRVSPERELGYVTRPKCARLPSVAPDAVSPPPTWPMFGTHTPAGSASVAEDALLGFAVASPALLLREGTRRLDLSVFLGDPNAPQRLVDEVRHWLAAQATLDTDLIARAFAMQIASASDVFGRLSRSATDQQAGRLAAAVSVEEMQRALEDTAGGGNRLYDLLLRAALRCVEPGQRRRFCSLFGVIFRRHLLGVSAEIDEAYRGEILALADELGQPDVGEEVRKLLEARPEGQLKRLLGDAFEVSLTTEAGWHRVVHWVVSRAESGTSSRERDAGLRFSMTLAPEVPPVTGYRAEVHGGKLRTRSPVIRLCLGARASFCAYSLLDGFTLASVVIDTAVRGVRDLRASSNLGQLDPSQPFNPFGPLPSVGAYLSVGSFEVAKKSVKRVKVNLEWSGLPTDYGGFATHYAGYGREFASEDFTVEQSVLCDGNWLPASSRERPVSTLFEPCGMTQRMSATSVLEVAVLDFLRPLPPGVDEADFDLQKGVRNGFLRLRLSGPEGAFGHAAYPLLLAGALGRNLRSKVQAKVPNPPYTPTLAAVTLDYESSDEVRFGEAAATDGDDMHEAVFHLHPFGQEPVRSSAAQRPPLLMPSYSTDGNLFIGLDGDVGSGALTLLFHLSGESQSRTAFDSPPLKWFYLAADGWRRLPAFHVTSDTTRGLMRSGIVTLDLPADFERRGGSMPAGPAWLRVGANTHLEAFPGLCAVHANGVEVASAVDDEPGAGATAEGRGALQWRSESAIAGLESVLQVDECFGGAPAETGVQFRTRISERLRHKQRAVTAWDYERLVLERFPRISKVKCFAGMVSSTPAPAPGNVVVVVVPRVGDGDPCAHPMASVLELREIRDYLAALASPFVQVEVRNPTYERVQVRCAVKFTDDGKDPWNVQKLNADVTGYLSPWTALGYRARFGWRIRRDDVEGFIRARDYVEFLTDFSMLQVASSDEAGYSLGDTAQAQQTAPASDGVRPRYPWSLALPMQRHAIQTLRTVHAIDAQVTGIDELEVGNTFIVGGSS